MVFPDVSGEFHRLVIRISLLWSFMKFLWTSSYSSLAWRMLVWYTARINVWFRISLRYAIVRLYCTTVLSYFALSSEPSAGIASKPRSSKTIVLIVSSSSLGGSHGLSASSGRQRLLVFRATCCSALNEASPIKSDEALYSSESLSHLLALGKHQFWVL